MSSYDKNTPETIQTLFGSIAPSYDKTNTILSLGMHKLWNRALVKKVNRQKNYRELLDLCAGTGEISFDYLRTYPKTNKITLLDFCQEMLDQAKVKSKKLKIDENKLTYIQGDAEKIALPDNSVDCATVAYGIRNVKNPKNCFNQVFRVMRSGGTFGILELTRPKNTFLRTLHGLYLKTLLPLLGKIATSNKEAYAYLSGSIEKFSSPEILSVMLKEAGFITVDAIPLFGGIATIIIAKKQ